MLEEELKNPEIKVRLKMLRKEELKITQKEFAQKIGIKGNTYTQIEKGTINLTIRNFNNICKMFDINESWLLYGKGNIFKQEMLMENLKNKYELDELTICILQNLLSLPKESKKNVLEYFTKTIEVYYTNNPSKLDNLIAKVKKEKTP